MTPGEAALWAAVAAAGLAGSSLWSGVETGVYTVSRVRLNVRAAEGDRAAAALRREIANPERPLATILVGNNACNYLGTLGLFKLLEGAGMDEGTLVVVQILVLTPVLLVFGEALPKELFRVHADTLAPRSAALLRATRLLLTAAGVIPLVGVFTAGVARLTGASWRSVARTGRDRIVELLRESAMAGHLSAAQGTLAERALALGRATVRDQMIPWASVRTLRRGIGPAELRRAVATAEHTRLPVVDAAGSVVGVADRLDLYAALAGEGAVRLADHTRPVARVEPATPVRLALAQMRELDGQVAVVERRGRPVGLVTAADLFEPLTGFTGG